MKKTIQISYLVGIIISFSFIFPLFSLVANAGEQSFSLDGKVYIFDNKKSDYEIDSLTYDHKITTYETTTPGFLSLNGEITKRYTKDGCTAFEIADDSVFSLLYNYNSKLMDADPMDGHLIEDDNKTVNGISLDSPVGYGVIILQTSFDGQKWVTCNRITNVTSNITISHGEGINDIQLVNGCYYRIIVAYKTEKKLDDTSFLKFDTSDYEYKKNAIVYEFYAGYKDASNTIPKNAETLEIGQTQAVSVDSGFYNIINMESDDPHLGWNLGRFVVSGFTKNKKNNDGDTVFLKNLDDRITLLFRMDDKADIDMLNGNEHLKINNNNGYDSAFNVPPQNFKRGVLIVRFTDYKGKTHDPIIYTNFLEALASPGANTKIQLFEEGDYEVTLDYEILNDKGFDKRYDYKIAFNFQVRNSNTMVYPRDIKTGSYLANDSVTENGFILDWAKSRYLDVNVNLSQWTKGSNGYVEDTRENVIVKESDEYTKTGIYTITVTNPTTDPYGKNPTVKRVYVGSDNVLIAYMNAKNSAYKINDINDIFYKVENEGYEITDDGELIPPKVTEPVTETTVVTTTASTTLDSTTKTTTTVQETKPIQTDAEAIAASASIDDAGENEKLDKENKESFKIRIIGAVAFVFGIILLLRKKNKKQ